jgi:UDP:flavonoid glycosyltransferase YjiC (YdhE family)
MQQSTADRCKRFVLTTFGSLGDLHPYIALARGLQQRGYRPLIATSAIYADLVEAAGIEFQAVRPDLDLADRDLLHQAMHPRKGTEVVIGKLVLPYLRQTYADLNQILQPDDILITHSISYAAHIAAQKHNLNWISVVLSPIAFFSQFDTPVVSGLPFSKHLEKWGPAVNRLIIKAVKRFAGRYCAPIYRLRSELGLAPGRQPLFEGQHSPLLVLAMFSHLLARQQPDWPTHTRITGFGYYDAAGNLGDLAPGLERFLESGPAPLIFALGSSAVFVAGDFYQRAARTAAKLNRRAVLVVGKDTGNLPHIQLGPDIIAVDYAPYSKLFARAAAVIHHGGIGTTAQVLRAGKPALFVPVAHDQPDNARRVERLGISRTLPFKKCSSAAMARELEILLGREEIKTRAKDIGKTIRSEDGIGAACDAIEVEVKRINQRKKTCV